MSLPKELFRVDQSILAHFECSKCGKIPLILKFDNRVVTCKDCGGNDKIFQDIVLGIHKNLKLSCLYSENGCIWEGFLGDLEEHLKQCDGVFHQCQWKKYGCEKSLPKTKMFFHELVCENRHCLCEHCDTIVNVLEFNNHLSACEELPITCPCGGLSCLQIPRKKISGHIKDWCPYFKINCPANQSGCTELIERRNVSVHLLDKHSDVLYGEIINILFDTIKKQPVFDDRIDALLRKKFDFYEEFFTPINLQVRLSSTDTFPEMDLKKMVKGGPCQMSTKESDFSFIEFRYDKHIKANVLVVGEISHFASGFTMKNRKLESCRFMFSDDYGNWESIFVFPHVGIRPKKFIFPTTISQYFRISNDYGSVGLSHFELSFTQEKSVSTGYLVI